MSIIFRVFVVKINLLQKIIIFITFMQITLKFYIFASVSKKNSLTNLAMCSEEVSYQSFQALK